MNLHARGLPYNPRRPLKAQEDPTDEGAHTPKTLAVSSLQATLRRLNVDQDHKKQQQTAAERSLSPHVASTPPMADAWSPAEPQATKHFCCDFCVIGDRVSSCLSLPCL